MRRRDVLIGAGALAGATLARRPALAAGKGTVRLAYVEWSDAIVANNILAAALEQAGYKVSMTPVSAAAMWEAVATGDADAMVAAWLPTTHAAYYAKLKNQVDLIGPNLTGARLGWATPDYCPLTSIADLKTKGGMIGNKVIGIDPGAGLMILSQKALKEYDLSDITLVDGSDATMVAALKDAIGRKAPIVVTAWSPHWMWAAFKLKYLDDPKHALGHAETVNTVARLGLKKDMPEVYGILSRFKLTLPEEQAVMLENQQKGAKPAATAAAWVKQHQDQVKSWIG